MKKPCLILASATLLIASSCRTMVLEDRIECPSFLFFEITNAQRFAPYASFYLTVERHPEGSRIIAEEPSLQAVRDRVYYVEVRGTPAVRGYGVLGDSERSVQHGDQWTYPLGCDADTLYRFSYTASVEPESFTVPLELIKEHTKVTLQLVGLETFTSAGGQCPFDIVVKSGTCGINARDGMPVRGAFEYRPPEKNFGEFCFTLPRQADQDLRLEIYGREHLSEHPGHTASFDLYSILRDQGGVTWREKNLPDVYVEIDYKETAVSVQVSAWAKEGLHYQM